MEDVVNYYRGTFIYFSGIRSVQAQARLFRDRGFFGRPVAEPGCSQHQYGYAVDVGITGPIIEDRDAQDFVPSVLALARQVGLFTVSRDPGHFQIFPGSEFRPWASAAGFCPDPSWLSRADQSLNFQTYTDCLLAATQDFQKASCFQRWIGRQSQIEGITFTRLPGRL